MKVPAANGFSANSMEGERKTINSELWHACAGPLVSLPPVGSLVVYFPQGHSEQMAASMHKDTDSIPGYPSLPSKLICVLLGVTMHADAETDEVYAQMTLQPANKYEEGLLASEMGLKQNKQPAEFFCKTLTASDTSTHGGFSVPRRAAEKIFPPLDFTMQPPAQELVAKDLHDVSWTFRHIYRGQPKRHLLTSGWSVFVSTKRLFAGDSVLFIRDEKSQLLLGIRRANRQQPALASSVLSSDSMHIGILAAAAHAAANSSPFTIFYNPRTSPSEFVVPMAKYQKAMYTQVTLGMRFRMMFETEESGVRRYMGTVTGISDLDPIRWKNSSWRNLQVGWDESTTTGEKRTRVSLWEIEPVTTPFYICPPPFFRPKFPKQRDDDSDVENAYLRAMPWLGDEFGMKGTQSSVFPGMSLVQWMAMQQSPQLIPSTSQPPFMSRGAESTSRIVNFQSQPSISPTQLPVYRNLQPGIAKPSAQIQQPPSRSNPVSFQPSASPQMFQFQQKLQQEQQLSQLVPRSQTQLLARPHSNRAETDAPSCSTSISPPSLPNRIQEDEVPAPVDSLLKHEARESDQLDASSATSFCLEDNVNECFPFPPLCLDSDVQIGGGVDGLLPDVMMARGFGSSFASSSPAIVPDMAFRPGFSNDAAVNDNRILNRGLWANQPPPRMRTYTKVQKRGSVGRSIDVTRYRGYDDLRQDLARMFGIEGQLEDPHRTDWKLVYVDHENDILLVGDDPWEEFVTCVQSIKVLSASEVQRISFDGELGEIPWQNQQRRFQ